MRKMILTGASGFLGRSLLARFLKNDALQVYALTGKPELLRREFDGPNMVFMERNSLTERADAAELVRGAYVINCAFPRNTDGICLAEGLSYINRLFCLCASYGAAAVINISSQSVYSQKRTEAADENTTLNLESVYATGKYATELMLDTACAELPHTNLRLSSLIGPDFNQRITNKLIDSILAGNAITVSVNQRRFGFMDVEDASGAILALLDAEPARWKTVYNVGTGRAYSLPEISTCLVKLSAELLQLAPQVGTVETEESGNTAVSGRLLQTDTGFVSSVSLEDSLRRIFQSKLARTRQMNDPAAKQMDESQTVTMTM